MLFKYIYYVAIALTYCYNLALLHRKTFQVYQYINNINGLFPKGGAAVAKTCVHYKYISGIITCLPSHKHGGNYRQTPTRYKHNIRRKLNAEQPCKYSAGL